MELDHILLAVRDLDLAAGYLDGEHGLRSYVGGVHPRWGTANRIVPLGTSYLELIAVVDAGVAAATDIGRWVADGAADDGAPIGWAVRPHDFDATTERLGLTAHEGSRATPDGTIVRWRMAGIDRAFSEPPLPWFIEWKDEATYPGMAQTPLDAHVVRVEMEGDAATLDEWLGAHAMPVDLRPGGGGITSVTLSTESGEIVLSR